MRFPTRDAGIVIGATVAAHLPGLIVSDRRGLPPFDPLTWKRWDSGNYISIASRGYILEYCGPNSPNRQPDDWCGNSAWFPGYPFLGRLLSPSIASNQMVLFLLARFFLVTMIALLWFGFLRQRPAREGIAGLALAVWFPSQVYLLAIFPMSMAITAALALVLAATHERWLLASAAAFVAAVTYPGAAFMGALASLVLLADRGQRQRSRWWLGAPGLASAAGVFSVAALQRHYTGKWTAYLVQLESWRHERAFPLVHIAERIDQVVNPTDPVLFVTGLQYLLMAVMVVATVVLTVRRARAAEPVSAERRMVLVIAAIVVGTYLLAHQYGVTAAAQRHELLLLPAVLLLARSERRWVLVSLVALLTLPMTWLFSNTALI